MFEIHLKESANATELNRVLDNKGSEHEFITREMNEAWLKDINTNPESPQAHIKPDNRDLTMEELLEMFAFFAEENVLKADTKFSRTSQEEIERLAAFVFEFQEDIEFVKNSDTLIEKATIPETHQVVLEQLEKPYVPPEKLPEDEQVRPDIQSGLLLCKSWGIEPFWVVFGQVEKPQFMKEKVYVDEVYNNIYRDKKGLAYLLLPLYDFSAGFFEAVFDQAWDLGLREHPVYFISMVYPIASPIQNEKELGDDLQGFYTTEERIERLKYVMESIKTDAKALPIELTTTNRNRIVLKDGEEHNILEPKLRMANAFLHSLKDDYAPVLGIEFDKFKKDAKLQLTFSNKEMFTV